ncbi:MAG: hypothetical protein K2G04_00355, partial [Oscillospiraceae bacterium]|nr:hypothetical protein [Oscillospiraceae bacterium]
VENLQKIYFCLIRKEPKSCKCGNSLSILNISVFATSEPTAMTSYEFHAAQADLIEKFVNGDIT